MLSAMDQESFVCGTITRENPINSQLTCPLYTIWATTKDSTKYVASDLNTIGNKKKYYSVNFNYVRPFAFSLTLEPTAPTTNPSPILFVPSYFVINERSINNDHFFFYNNKNISQLNFDMQNTTNKKGTYLLTIKAYIAEEEEPLIITVPINAK